MPHNRTRGTQRTCGRPECREAQKKKSQAVWAKRNRTYWKAKRLAEKVAAASSGEVPNPRPPPREMGELPWDIAQEAIGPQATVVTSFFVRHLLLRAQDALSAQVPAVVEEIRRLHGLGPQDPIAPAEGGQEAVACSP